MSFPPFQIFVQITSWSHSICLKRKCFILKENKRQTVRDWLSGQSGCFVIQISEFIFWITAQTLSFQSWYLSVVYFNQHLGAAHSRSWSKYPFSCFGGKRDEKGGKERKLRRGWQQRSNLSTSKFFPKVFQKILLLH